MFVALNIAWPNRKIIKPGLLFVAGYLIVAGIALKDYLAFQSLRGIVGIIALLFVLQTGRKSVRSNRFALVASVFLLLCILMPVKTLLYFTISFGLLFFIECYYGKTGALPAIIIILVSPVFKYAADTFSFPVRLELTSLAGSIFSLAGIETITKGNVIIQGAYEFSVDPGCMGLNMMETSLLLGVILIAFFEQRLKNKIGGWSIFSYFGIILLLNVIANLFRIIILVQFAILPGTIAHDVTGLACLLVYVFLPAVWLAKVFIRRSRKQEVNLYSINRFIRRDFFLHSIILGCITTLAVYVANADTYRKIDTTALKSIHDFSPALYAPGIVKLRNDQSLIYIKYIRGFYDTDHNPMICWKGSGYTFERVQREEISGHEIYTAELVNEGDKLFSAWWYSNGTIITADQLRWRWEMLKKKENYALINITCATKKELDCEIKKIITEKTLSVFLTDAIYQ